jgi:hypothetical protein
LPRFEGFDDGPAADGLLHAVKFSLISPAGHLAAAVGISSGLRKNRQPAREQHASGSNG